MPAKNEKLCINPMGGVSARLQEVDVADGWERGVEYLLAKEVKDLVMSRDVRVERIVPRPRPKIQYGFH